jgi:acyl-coenzyme A synthetase/AMP-(fatty) acid ligase
MYVNSNNNSAPDVSIKGEHVFDYVWKDAAATMGDSVALTSEVTGEELTFKECVATSKRLSAAMYDQMGARKGDVLAMMMPNCLGKYFKLFRIIIH